MVSNSHLVLLHMTGDGTSLSADVQHPFVDTALHREAIDVHFPGLSHAVHAADGLVFQGHVETGIHDEHLG